MTDSDRLEALCAWAESKGWHVDFGPHEDEAIGLTRTINIDSRRKPRQQVYALCHECGHVLDDECHRERLLPSEKYYSDTQVGRIAQIECEINAWRRGWSLARRLKLGLDRRGYTRAAVNALSTYIVI